MLLDSDLGDLDHRGGLAEILRESLKLVAIQMMRPRLNHLKAYYAVLSARSFFPGLVSNMDSGLVLAISWEGNSAIKTEGLQL